MTDQYRQQRIHPVTTTSDLRLTVANLSRSVDFYTRLIGLRELDRAASSATLGVPGRRILRLDEQPGAEPWPRGGRSFAGLYHFALLLPTRADLGVWLQHWLDSDMPLPGQGDHFVSEALYLEDPDGHGIEIYRDRPRSDWQWQNGQVRMGVEPVDIQGVLKDGAASGNGWNGLPSGTTLGHIHLQVTDIETTARFYRDVLGFDIVAQMPSALFMSAGGYHHHIGANIWHSRGVDQAPEEFVRLKQFAIELVDEQALHAVLERLDEAHIERRETEDGTMVQDPSGIEVELRRASTG